jgi:hypothetical protein
MQSSAEIDGEWLKRIVALLFALADLANRAGDASRSTRRTVLGILWPAEAVAWEFVAGFSPGFDAAGCASEAARMDPVAACPSWSAIWSDDRTEAALLASRFRALALLLAYLLAGMRNPGCARYALASNAVLVFIHAPGVARLGGRARDPP